MSFPSMSLERQIAGFSAGLSTLQTSKKMKTKKDSQREGHTQFAYNTLENTDLR